MARVIERFEIEARMRRLRTPIRTAAGLLQALPGVEVRGHGTDGRVGRGEAPWPGSWEQAERLAPLLRATSEKWIGGSPAAARRELASDPRVDAASAWALDTALADLAVGRAGLAALHAEGDAPLDRVRTNALIVADAPAAIEQAAARLAADGEHTLKLKVGLGSLRQDVERVAAARAGSGAGVALRLDANEAWDEAEARRRLSAFAPFAPDYLEQPVAAEDLAALARLRRGSPLPIAADEAARGTESARQVLDLQAADVLVLKAPLLGVSGAARELVARARAGGIRVVLSSLHDGAASLWASVALAAGLGLEEAHGLATGGLLAEPADAPRALRGRIELPS